MFFIFNSDLLLHDTFKTVPASSVNIDSLTLKRTIKQQTYERELAGCALELRNWIKECTRRPLTLSWQPEQMQPRPRIPSNTSDSTASRPRVMESSARAADPNSVSGEVGRSGPWCFTFAATATSCDPHGFPPTGRREVYARPPRVGWIDVVWAAASSTFHRLLHWKQVGISPEVAAASCSSGSAAQAVDQNGPFELRVRTTCYPWSAPEQKLNCRL